MKLTKYLADRNATTQASDAVLIHIARSASCAASTLRMIALGHKQPSARLARDIELATEGAVTRAELRPDLFGEIPGTHQAAAGQRP